MGKLGAVASEFSGCLQRSVYLYNALTAALCLRVGVCVWGGAWRKALRKQSEMEIQRHTCKERNRETEKEWV